MSKRFAALCCSPELLREVHAGADSLSALRLLTAWLAQHRLHVQRLYLTCPSGRARLRLPPAEASTFEAALTACLMTVGTTGQLLELSVRGMGSAEWLAAMPSLRHLELCPYGTALHIPPAISTLTALNSLQLGADTSFEPGVRLPLSITFLQLQHYGCDLLPEQVRRC